MSRHWTGRTSARFKSMVEWVGYPRHLVQWLLLLVVGKLGVADVFLGNRRRVRDAILEDADTLHEETVPDDDGFLDFVNVHRRDNTLSTTPILPTHHDISRRIVGRRRGYFVSFPDNHHPSDQELGTLKSTVMALPEDYKIRYLG